MNNPRLLPLAVSLALVVVAACTGSASGPGSPSAPTSPPPRSPAPPDQGVSGAPGGGGLAPGLDPSQAKVVVPQAGLLNVHPVGISAFEARTNGRRVAVKVYWTSGVEPCYALDSVAGDRDGGTFTLTVREGSANANVACIEIALLKAAVVDLGELEPGTYTIRAGVGDAQPVTITVE